MNYECEMNKELLLLRYMNERWRVHFYFSNGEKLVEIHVTPVEAITIADVISQISETAVKENESYSTMDVLMAMTNKKALMKHMEVNDED